MQSTNQGSIISVRTSDASYKTVSSGGSYSHSTTQQSTVFHHDYNRADTWNHITLPVTTATGKTTSFTAIHEDVIQDMNVQLHSEITSKPRRARGDQQEGDATGEVPLGDMLLPLFVMAVGYIFIKLFRNHKTSNTL